MKKGFRLFAALGARGPRRCRVRERRGRRQRAMRATPTGGPAVVDTIGETEGELNLIAWVGYTEDGTTAGYESYDWVTPFEDATGCMVIVKYADSSDEMFNLMTQQAGATTGSRRRATPRTG